MKTILPILTALLVISCGASPEAAPEKQSLDSKLSTLSEEKNDISSDVEDANGRVAFLAEQVESLEALSEDIKVVYEGQLDDKRAAFNETSGEIAALEVQLEFATAQEKQRIDAEIQHLETRATSLNNDVNRAKNDLSNAQKRSDENLGKLKKDLDDITKKYDESAAKAKSLEDSNKDLNDQISKLEKENEELQAEVDRLTSANDELQKQIDEAQALIAPLGEKLAGLQQTRSDLGKSLTEEKENLSKVTQDLAEVSATLESQNERLKTLRGDIDSAKGTRDQKQDELDGLNKELNDLKAGA